LNRYLEHQRIYIFGRGRHRRVFMSSADLMERNLDWRVEAAFPIFDAAIKQQIVDMMALQVADRAKARVLDADQSNPYVDPERDGIDAQNDTYIYHQRLDCGEPFGPLELPLPEPLPPMPPAKRPQDDVAVKSTT